MIDLGPGRGFGKDLPGFRAMQDQPQPMACMTDEIGAPVPEQQPKRHTALHPGEGWYPPTTRLARTKPGGGVQMSELGVGAREAALDEAQRRELMAKHGSVSAASGGRGC